MDTKDLEYEALHLPPEDRAKLAQKLLLSLDAPSRSENEQAWLDEAERRGLELDEGLVQPVPADEVRRNLSKACERGLRAEIARADGEQWKAENARAIASSNAYVTSHGLPLEKYRQF